MDLTTHCSKCCDTQLTIAQRDKLYKQDKEKIRGVDWGSFFLCPLRTTPPTRLHKTFCRRNLSNNLYECSCVCLFVFFKFWKLRVNRFFFQKNFFLNKWLNNRLCPSVAGSFVFGSFGSLILSLSHTKHTQTQSLSLCNKHTHNTYTI